VLSEAVAAHDNLRVRFQSLSKKLRAQTATSDLAAIHRQLTSEVRTGAIREETNGTPAALQRVGEDRLASSPQLARPVLRGGSNRDTVTSRYGMRPILVFALCARAPSPPTQHRNRRRPQGVLRFRAPSSHFLSNRQVIYPGLWAQVLENSSFEENLWSADNLRRRVEDEPALARARSWVAASLEPLDYARACATSHAGAAANSARSLYLMACPRPRPGCDSSLPAGASRGAYVGSLWVKHAEGRPRSRFPCDVVTAPGDAGARVAGAPGTDWRKYDSRLTEARAVARLEPVDSVAAAARPAFLDQAFCSRQTRGRPGPDMVEVPGVAHPVVRFGALHSGYHWRDGVVRWTSA